MSSLFANKYVRIALTVVLLGIGAYFRVDVSNFLPRSETVPEVVNTVEIEVPVEVPAPDAGR